MDLSDHKTATYCEIMQQPDVWLKAYDLVCRNEAAIQTFISNNHIGKDTEIILAGAGTSAFIGNALAGIFVEKGYSQCLSRSDDRYYYLSRKLFTYRETCRPHFFCPFGKQP